MAKQPANQQTTLKDRKLKFIMIPCRHKKSVRHKCVRRQCSSQFLREELLRLWKQHGVDHVDHAILACDVGFDNFRLVDHHGTVFDFDSYLTALNCLGLFAIKLDHIFGHHLTWDDVVGQDRNQLVLVLWLHKISNRPFGEFRESLFCWCEHSERTVS